MKKSHKILLFIISLIGLGVSAGILSLFYHLPFITDTVKAYQAFYPWMSGIFAAFCSLSCFCFFVLMLAALLLPNKSNDLILAKDKGRIFFSKQTVESAIRYSFADLEGIVSCRVKAGINKRPEKTRIYVKLAINDLNKLIDLTEKVQKKIEASLKTSLGVSVESITVKVIEFNQDNKPLKEENADTVKESRVI